MATAGKTKTATGDPKPINPADHALVIVVSGVKTLETGPYKGQKALAPTEIYVGGQKVALVSHLELTMEPNEVLPRLRFTFSDLDPQIVNGHPQIKTVYEKHVGLVRDALPWALYTSPISSNNPNPTTVLDPGTVQPKEPLKR